MNMDNTHEDNHVIKGGMHNGGHTLHAPGNRGSIFMGVENVHVADKLTVVYEGSTSSSRRTSEFSGINTEDVERGIASLASKLKREYGNSGACLRRLPWLEGNNVKDHYVDLTIEERNASGKVVKVKNFQYDQILLPAKRNENRPKTILIQAGPGFGKSTLAVKIANDWATITDNPAREFSIVILCMLRDVPKDQNVEEHILNWCFETLQVDFGQEVNINAILISERENILIILDGYDEIGRKRREFVKEMLGSTSFFHPSTFIVTSRPENLEKDFTNCFQRHVHISALSAESREKMVDRVFLDYPRRAERVKRFLRDNQLTFLSELSPLLLFSVCSIFDEDRLSPIKKGSDLIIEVIRVMFSRAYARKYGLTTKLEKNDLDDILFQLGKLFFEKLRVRVLHFEKEELAEITGHGKDFFRDLGLFQKTSETSDDESWETIHKVIMDVLAVYYLNKTIKQKDDDLILMRERIVECLGPLEDVKVIVFLQRPNVMAFCGQSLSEIVYLAFEHRSVFDGVFCTFEDLKVQFREFVYDYREENVLVYTARRSRVTFWETFKTTSISPSKRFRVKLWSNGAFSLNTIEPKDKIRFNTCVVKISDSTHNLLHKCSSHEIGITCIKCNDLKTLLTRMFQEEVTGNWSITFRHKIRQFEIVVHHPK